MPRPFDQVKRDVAVTLYQQLRSVTLVAKAMQVTKQRVSQLLNDVGIRRDRMPSKVRNLPYVHLLKASTDIETLYATGHTPAAIAVTYGVPEYVIRSLLKTQKGMGIPTITRLRDRVVSPQPIQDPVAVTDNPA